MVKRQLRVEELPFFSTVLCYTMHHGNQYVTPAHFVAAALSTYEVRRLMMKAFNVDSSKVFEILHGLFEYCEEMRMDYIKEGSSVHMGFSLEMMDFLDNYNRDIYRYENLNFGTVLYVVSKCSDSISSIFEAVLNKTMDYIVKTVISTEGKSATFGVSLNDYFDYLDYIKDVTPAEFAEMCQNMGNDVEDETTRIQNICRAAIQNLNPNIGFLHIVSVTELADIAYLALTMALRQNAPFAQVNAVSIPLLNLGYEEVSSLLEATGKSEELNSIMEKLAILYNNVDDKLVKEAGEVMSHVMEGVPAFGNSTAVKAAEEAKSKDVYMFGNEKILEVAKDTLVRLDNPNLIVLGDSGSGKTTFVEKIVSMANNDEFKDIGLSIYPCKMDIGVMTSKAKFKGEFESNFRRFIADMVKKANAVEKKPLLLIEDINQTVPIGATSGDVTDTYLLVLEAMNKYHFPIIGTCTYDDYRLTVAKKRRYNDRFTIVRIEEPSREAVLTILRNKCSDIEKAYEQEITDEALNRVYDLSAQFIRDKKFPAKAITLLNQTCAYSYTHGKKQVGADSVEALMERDYSIPSARLNTNLAESIREIADDVKNHVFGQNDAVDILVKYWKIKQAGLTKENKPIASLLFVGPTGVGKTELAKQFAKSIGYKLIRFDMSEYKEGHTASRLIGSPAGYVGYEDGGLLVNAIKSNPNCVLLLDEIEKAHSNIYDILLQIMDNAELTGSQGEKVDFQNVVILMTSNCGARDAESARKLGFNQSEDDNITFKADIMQAELQRQFTPEFRGRLSAVVNFNPLSKDMCMQITELRLKELKDSLRKTKEYITLEFEPALKEQIVDMTLKEKAGGRSIEKYIDEKVKDKLLDTLLALNTGKQALVTVGYADNEITTTVM